MKLYQTLSFDCSTCYGKGYVYWGNAEDYSVEPCDCVAGETNTDLPNL